MEDSSIINLEVTKTILNLGSGFKKIDGATNIDGNKRTDPDLVLDIRKLDTVYKPDTVDEVHIYHVLEHFTILDATKILTDVFSILKPGGFVVLEMPDIMKCAINLLQAKTDGDPFRVERLGLLGFYGEKPEEGEEETNEFMLHRWGFWPEYLGGILNTIGYTAIVEEEPQTKDFSAKSRDFRMVGAKF